MYGLKQLFLLIAWINVSMTIAQYMDDSDYINDYELYDELLPNIPARKKHDSIKQEQDDAVLQDDFYIINDYEEGIRIPQENDGYNINDGDMNSIIETDEGLIKITKPSPYREVKWFKVPEKVYQYTKHRIPGYDYDELDFIGGIRLNKCDSRSFWSHCVCQFTCLNPNQVDCYIPCISGCECKEDFVYDENTKQCIPPEMCSVVQNFNVYKK